MQSPSKATWASELFSRSICHEFPPPNLEPEEARDEEEMAGRCEGTILLVEDDEDLKLLAARVLREKGYSVLKASNPRQAIDAVEGDASIDLVLTDIVMPETNGPQLVERLRARRSDFKVLYMSGYTADTSEAHRIVNSSELLDKPFTPADPLRKVNEALRGS